MLAEAQHTEVVAAEARAAADRGALAAARGLLAEMRAALQALEVRCWAACVTWIGDSVRLRSAGRRAGAAGRDARRSAGARDALWSCLYDSD